jgi:hypothetical protein
MTFVVPFDGSDLAEAALTKAKLYAIALDELSRIDTEDLFPGGAPELVAVCVVPESARYARKKGWIDEGEEFRARTVAERLHERVTDIAPSANFQTVRVDRDATDLFIGSENAGRIVTPVTSVGRGVATDDRFDVHIVRRKLPPKLVKRLRSEFAFPD